MPRHLRHRSAHHGGPHLPRGRADHGDGRHRRDLWQVHQLGGLHRIGTVGAVPAGCLYRNGEFIQVHPTSVPGEDKLRLMSESARGEGGRVWVPKKKGDKRDWKSIPESERWYFLEEWYPKYGNLVPRDVATRAIHKVVYEYGLGIEGRPMVYLDL